MGQQQLLLIVLGVIVVGIAVVVGINLFSANAESSTQDSMVSQGTSLGALAQQYYKKPEAMGGGGNKFDGFNETKVSAELLDTPDATWLITSASGNAAVLTGTPKNADYTWKVTTRVSPTSINSEVGTGD
jgi:hypothetical protein